MRISKYGRYWAVYDAQGVLICVTVYKKGAEAVVRRLQELDAEQEWVERNGPREDSDNPLMTCPLF